MSRSEMFEQLIEKEESAKRLPDSIKEDVEKYFNSKKAYRENQNEDTKADLNIDYMLAYTSVKHAWVCGCITQSEMYALWDAMGGL